MQLLTENRDVLDQIAKILIEKEKINGKELLEVIKSANPNLVSEKALDAVTEMMAPVLEAQEPELKPAPAQMSQTEL